MDRFMFLTVDGLARGAVLATFALALVLIWRAARVVNFAQGAMAVATAYAAASITSATGSYWLGFGGALVAGLLLGIVVERGVMRLVDHGSPLSPVIVALGLVLLIQAVLGMVYGNGYRPIGVPLSRTALVAGAVSPFDLFVFGTVAALVVLLALLFTRTSLGLRMRAAAFAPEVSRLLGVNVAGMLTVGWALASAAGSLAALLTVPTGLGLHPTAMDVVFISAFTAAIIGGLDSPAGAVVGGVGVGLLLSYVTGYLDGDLAPLAVAALLIVVLLIRPDGLVATTRARRA